MVINIIILVVMSIILLTLAAVILDKVTTGIYYLLDPSVYLIFKILIYAFYMPLISIIVTCGLICQLIWLLYTIIEIIISKIIDFMLYT